MKGNSPSPEIPMSRRLFLNTAVAVFSLGVLLLFPELRTRGATTRKISQKAAHYQGHPHDGKMCMNCRHFLPPDARMKEMMRSMSQMGGMMNGMPMSGMGPGMKIGHCEVVEGRVSPMGYCQLYLPLGKA